MRKGAITRRAVLNAMAECDELGRDAFLAKYRFGAARSYVVVHDGQEYDSKAIAGVAHQWDQGRALRHDEFSGGEEHAAAWLKRAGFQVKAVRNPDWARDEIILACQLVFENGWRGLDAWTPGWWSCRPCCSCFPSMLKRNAMRSSVIPTEWRARRSTSPRGTRSTRQADQGRRPRRHGAGGIPGAAGRDDPRRAPDPRGIADGELQELAATGDEEFEDDYSAPEGRLLMRRHRARERNKGLRKKKIDSVLRRGGRLACESCGFDYEEVYGDRGAGYIECHHVVPLHEAGEGRTKLSDLALICANCHRMIHRAAPWPTPAELRATIERKHADDRRAAAALGRPRRAADEESWSV